MSSRIKRSSHDVSYQKLALRIELEELQLVLSIRQAEKQLKRLNCECNSYEDSGIESEREAWAIKTTYYRNRLSDVRESLDRLRSGKFGVCASCGDRISEKRLSAVPSAIYCLECQEASERDHSLVPSSVYGFTL